jgi:predicted membrane-bound mannosyltransferase
MSYYSRYYIMEAPLVLFTFLLIAAGYRYARGGHLGWCVLAGTAAGLMYATKETWVFAIAAMVVALGAAALWQRLIGGSALSHMGGKGAVVCAGPPQRGRQGRSNHVLQPGISHRLWNWRVLAALVVWAIVAGVFFSSFFTNARGPIDAVAAYAHAFGRAMGGPDEGGNLHLHPWHFYLQCLFYTNYPGRGPVWTEALIGVLAVVGMAAGFTGRGLGKADGRLVRFLAVYTVALLGIYTVLPYKTPWCALSPLHGMILLAGVGAGALVRLMPRIRLKAALCVVLVAGAGHLGRLAFLTNFRCYDDRRNPWVYAHTLSGAVKLGQRAEGIASIDPAGYHMRINVFTPDPHDQWPLPWYLRRFDRVAYFTDAPANPDAPMIIFRPEAWPRLQERLKDKDNYQYEHVGLRPAVVLTIGIRADLWKKYRDEVLAKRRPPASAQASPPGRPVP